MMDEETAFTFAEVPVTNFQGIDAPHALIDVRVGMKTIQLAIDTGHAAAPILLSPALLADLDVIYTGRIQENYDAFGRKYESQEFILPEVSIGSLTLDQVMGMEFLFPYNTPGVIGMPFLKQFNILFDYPKGRFGLYQRGYLPSYVSEPEWKKVKLLSPSPGIVIPVKFRDGEKTYYFLLDSPSIAVDDEKKSYDLIPSQSELGKRLQQMALVEASTSEAGVMGRFCSSDFHTLCGMLLSGLDFMLVNLQHTQSDALLGYHFLNQHPILVDLDHDCLYLKPIT